MEDKFQKSLELLEDYFKNVSDEQFQKDWNAVDTKYFNYGVITVNDYLQVMRNDDSQLI